VNRALLGIGDDSVRTEEQQSLLRLVDRAGDKYRTVTALWSDHRLHLWRVSQTIAAGVWLEPHRHLTGIFSFVIDSERGRAIHWPFSRSL